MSQTARNRRDRKRAYCQSVVISEIILRDAFRAAGAARQAGANRYRARLALLPGESRPKHRDAQTHWSLTECKRSTRYKGTETLSAKNKRGAPAVSSSLRACITKFILQATCCTQAGWRQAACSQAASNVGANRNGEVLVCTLRTAAKVCFWERRTVSGASTPPTSGAELEPSGTEKRVFAQLYPMLLVVATAASSWQTNICSPSTNFWIGSALRRAIGGFSS